LGRLGVDVDSMTEAQVRFEYFDSRAEDRATRRDEAVALAAEAGINRERMVESGQSQTSLTAQWFASLALPAGSKATLTCFQRADGSVTTTASFEPQGSKRAQNIGSDGEVWDGIDAPPYVDGSERKLNRNGSERNNRDYTPKPDGEGAANDE